MAALPTEVDAPLRGVGQVVFSDSPLTGVAFLIALFVDSPWLAVLAIIGCGFGTFTGLIISPSSVSNGMSGCNGVLVGCGYAVFMGLPAWGWETIACTAIGSVASVIVAHMMSAMYSAPVFTFPFNIVLTATLLYIQPFAGAVVPAPMAFADLAYMEGIKAIFTGVSQMFVVNNWIAGIIILIGLACYSVRLAGSTLLGSLIGLVTAVAIGADAAQIRDGLWGYDAALTAAAIVTFWEPSTGLLVFLVVASAVTAALHGWMAAAMGSLFVPCGTLPFCCVATAAFFLNPPQEEDDTKDE